MTAQLISAEAVAILLQPGEAGDSEAAGALVRSLLIEAGLPPWEDMEIELFPGADGTLLMARRTDLIWEGYAFPDFDILVAATAACNPGWPSQLWSYKDEYYLLLRRPICEESPDMNEFSLTDKLSGSMTAHIREHGKLMIEREAVTLLQKFFN